MNNEELDAAISERFRAYEAGIRLPDEFKRRFLGSVRRKRALRRAWMLAFVCATAAACAMIVHFSRGETARNAALPTLVAASTPTNETSEVSCLMLLGYLRECFSRTRSTRRKEEE